MQRYLIPIVVVVVLIAGNAVLQGIWTERWTQRDVTAEQQAFAQRLKQLPITLGDWESVEAKIDERQLIAARAVGNYSRRFYNRYAPDKQVDIFLVCGHPSDITIHTPDQCYVLSGFKEGDQQRIYVDYGKSAAEFSTNQYSKGSAIGGPQHLRVYWTFSEDGRWLAPTLPKVELRNKAALYKLYAITPVQSDTRGRPEEGPARDFLREFIPVMNAVLFPQQTPAASPAAGEKPADDEKPAADEKSAG